MMDAIAVFNAGSSSIKFSLFLVDGQALVADMRGQIEGIHGSSHFVAKDRGGELLAERRWDGVSLDHAAALAHIMEFLDTQRAGTRLVGVGHRVVHGGPAYGRPVRVSPAVLDELGKLIPLAPLHQRHNLAPVHALRARLPALPQVVCFDTAFHRGNPDVAERYALPAELHAAGIRRYGFHGLSYEYIASVLPQVDAGAAQGRCVVLHLGNGASMCALRAGIGIASTMGFSTLDGLPMGTRSGAIDPGVLLYLMDERGFDARALETLLYQQSGLLGMSGIAGDVRTLLASGDPAAAGALDVFVYRIGRELGSLAAALGGLDALVFTAGIGENAPSIRQRVCRDAAWLGVELDEAANLAGGPRISTRSSAVSAWVLPTNEELMIARHTLRLLGAGEPSAAENSPPA
jgi:acetate kinase